MGLQIRNKLIEALGGRLRMLEQPGEAAIWEMTDERCDPFRQWPVRVFSLTWPRRAVPQTSTNPDMAIQRSAIFGSGKLLQQRLSD